VTAPSAKEIFRQTFGFAPSRQVRVPGRVILIGEHTGQHEGLILSATVDRYVELAGSPRTDGQFEIVAAAKGPRSRFPMHRLCPDQDSLAETMLRGVLRQLQTKGVHFSGCTIAVQALDDPTDTLGGLSALAVATALLIRELYPYSLGELGPEPPPRRDAHGRLPPPSPVESSRFARACYQAGQTVDLPIQLEAPLACLLGKAHHLLHIDTRFETVNHSPFVGETLSLCDLAAEDGNWRSAKDEFDYQCRSAAKELRTSSLRSVDLLWLKANRQRLTKLEFECAYHVVAEAQRAVAAEKALLHDDYAQVGSYLTQSQQSADQTLLCVPPAWQRLAHRVAQSTGCLGARICGGQPHLLSIVHYHQIEPFLRSLSETVVLQLGQFHPPKPIQIVNGVARPAP